ncbi:MAG: succinate dehydrogenase, cytochrome b556 subunit [Alphaproteobacteria bacterium]|nr:succinate dehydrogenase, cytochrome b556 subunit [Alphaproteobacteria bacterium]
MSDSKPAARERPLSPHLQIYRWPVTMATSITHRITGVGNALGTVLVLWWLVALATGPDAYALVQAVMGSIPGRLILFGFTLSLVYHMLNGIRHLFWDAGIGFRVSTASVVSVIIYTLALAITLGMWAAAYALGGGVR